MANIKINLYMAADDVEYKRAIDYLTNDERVVMVKDLGPMPASDFFEMEITTYVIVYSSPIEVGIDIAKFMEQPFIDLEKAYKEQVCGC